jgi:hypothetical protein
MANALSGFLANGYDIGKVNLSIGKQNFLPLDRATYGPMISVPIKGNWNIGGGAGTNLSRDYSIGARVIRNF